MCEFRLFVYINTYICWIDIWLRVRSNSISYSYSFGVTRSFQMKLWILALACTIVLVLFCVVSSPLTFFNIRINVLQAIDWTFQSNQRTNTILYNFIQQSNSNLFQGANGDYHSRSQRRSTSRSSRSSSSSRSGSVIHEDELRRILRQLHDRHENFTIENRDGKIIIRMGRKLPTRHRSHRSSSSSSSNRRRGHRSSPRRYNRRSQNSGNGQRYYSKSNRYHYQGH